MGVGRSFGEAYGKAQLAAGNPLPAGGRAFISVRQADKGPLLMQVANDLRRVGFELIATSGTAEALMAAGIPCGVVNKVKEGRPHIVDMITNVCLQRSASRRYHGSQSTRSRSGAGRSPPASTAAPCRPGAR